MTFELQNVMEVEVFGIVSALSSSKATGHDRISPKLLKDSAGVITSSLTQIFNQSLLTGIFPDDFKVAIISPIFKSESKLECNNYRSFSSDVTAAILVYQNNEMAAILVYGTGISSFLFKYFVLFHHPTGATDHVSENDL